MKNTKQEQKFKVYCSTNINKSVNKELVSSLVQNNEPLILEAVASSNSVDLDGDYMTNECLEDMKKQAIGLNIFLDHEHTIDSIVGSVTDVIETSSDIFKVKFSVLPKYEWYLTDLLENGINLGLSIGASVLDFEESDTGWKINKVKLVEISIVGIPANWDTFGTVQTSKELGMVTAKCFNGACKQIIDNLSLQKDLVVKEFEDGEDPDEDGVITEEEVIKLINQALVEAKDQIITEIVSEYHLDSKEALPQANAPSEAVNQSTNSSDDEDKEKNLDMEKEEIVELIKEHSLTIDMVKEVVVDALKEVKEAEAEVTETPIVDKEEDVEVTKANEDVEVEEDVELEKSTDEEVEKEEDVEVEKSSEEVNEVDEVEVEVEKSSDKVDVGVTVETFDMEELRKSIKEELRAEIEAEVEEELLKALSTERKPVAHEQPKVEEKVEKEASDENKVEKSSNVMTTRKMAEHLLK